MQLASFIITKHNLPFKLLFWPSHYFLLFSQERLKNHPKSVLKHISLQSNTKCANVISQEVGLQGCRDNGQWFIVSYDQGCSGVGKRRNSVPTPFFTRNVT